MGEHAAKVGIPVALHDVEPRTFAWAASLVERMRALGLEPAALMVVPAPGGEPAAGAGEEGAWREWLREQRARGVLLYCHGFRHESDPRLPRGPAGSLQDRLNGGQAEFAGLSGEECGRLLDSALAAFRALGCGEPDGFVPPAWFAPRGAARLAFARGLPAWESRLFLSAPGSRRFSFPVSLFSGSDRAFALSCALAGLALRLPFRPVRLALHPADFSTPDRAARMDRLLEELARRGGSAPYPRLAP